MMKKLLGASLAIVLFQIYLPAVMSAQDLIPLIYKGYAEGNDSKGLNGIYDISKPKTKTIFYGAVSF